MALSNVYPLAQLVDLLPDWTWMTLFAVGLLAPLVGMTISLAAKTATKWKGTVVAVFYAISMPLAAMVFLAKTENPVGVCSLIVLMPIGMILGLVVIAARGQIAEKRGFEVGLKTEEQID